jgi:gas vesicle protein
MKEELEKLEKMGEHNRKVIKSIKKSIREYEYESIKKMNEAFTNIYEGFLAIEDIEVCSNIAEALKTVLEANTELMGAIQDEYEILYADRVNKGEEI